MVNTKGEDEKGLLARWEQLKKQNRLFRVLEGICVGLFGSIGLHFIAKLVFGRYQKNFKKLDEAYYLYEKVPATAHALFTFLAGVYVVYIKKYYAKDVCQSYPKEIDFIFSEGIGFLLYDFYCMIKQKRIISTSLWIHHLFYILGVSLSMLLQKGNFFPTFFLITEVTLVPTNILWYLKKAFLVPKDSALFKSVNVIRIILFLLFRFPVGFLSLIHTLRLGQFKKFYQESILVTAPTTFNVLLFTILNLRWCYSLIKNITQGKLITN